MTLEQAVVDKLRSLPPKKQLQVLAFVEALGAEVPPKPPKPRSPKGMWADFGFDISAEDLDELRKEMWANFPRDDLA